MSRSSVSASPMMVSKMPPTTAGFMGINLGRESTPDATSLLRFCRLLEIHQLTQVLFETINQHLARQDLLLKKGTIVDATLITAWPLIKNREGNQCHIRMKAHTVDAMSGLAHSLVGTAANVAFVTQVDQLLHSAETYVSGDTGYTGAAKRPEHAGRDVILQHGQAATSITAKAVSCTGSSAKIEYTKVRLHAKVKHPLQVIKVRFYTRKVRYRGLEKNIAPLLSLFGLAKRYLQRATGETCLKGGAGPLIRKMKADIGPKTQNKAGTFKKNGLKMGAVRASELFSVSLGELPILLCHYLCSTVPR
ncbi:transposase [Pseudomonas sp. PDM10]|uniref:transposase n=1 Tax=Pseudomonas sp. PDM10 TaxID=2769269 RepID=UPI00399AC86E